MGTDTNREAGVLQVRDSSVSDYLGDGRRDGELGAGVLWGAGHCSRKRSQLSFLL